MSFINGQSVSSITLIKQYLPKNLKVQSKTPTWSGLLMNVAYRR